MTQIIHLDRDNVNFVYTTDWHLTDRPPGRRTGNYREEIMAKVEFVRDLTEKVNGVGLCGGDVFHSKSPNAYGNTFSLLGRLARTLRSYPTGQIYGAVGNHDIYMDRMDSLNDQPLGSLIASGVYNDMTTGPVIFENRDQTVRVQVDAYPYADDMITLQRVLTAPPREPGVTHRIAILHQYGNPGERGSMYGHPTIGYNEMADCDYDIALWGHDHSREETVRVGNTLHIRLGSLSRASLDGDEVDRPVSAVILSITPDRVKYQEKPIPVKPLEIAFAAADQAVTKVRESDGVTEFFAEMDEAVSGLESTDPREVLRQLCPVEEMRLYDLAVEHCGL